MLYSMLTLPSHARTTTSCTNVLLCQKDPPKDKTKVGVEPNASATPPEGAEEKDDKEEDESDLMGKFKFW